MESFDFLKQYLSKWIANNNREIRKNAEDLQAAVTQLETADDTLRASVECEICIENINQRLIQSRTIREILNRIAIYDGAGSGKGRGQR